jgi:O-antigen/teichoic acid export membrane protein
VTPPAGGSKALSALARGGAANLIGAGLTAAANLVLVILVSRGLTKDAAGVVFIVTSVFVLAETAVRLGTDVGVVHFIATARGRQSEPAALTDAIWACAVPVGIGAIFGAAVVAALMPTVIRSTGVPTAGLHSQGLAAVVALGIPVAAGYDLLTAATRGLGRSRPTVVLERFVRPLLQIAGTSVALATGSGVLGFAIAWIAPYALVAPLMVGWTATILHSLGAPLRSTHWPHEFPRVWRFTAPRSVTGVLQILLQRLDIVIVGAILGSGPAAVYTGATRFLVVGQLGNQAISFVFQPQLARMVARGELDQARALFKTTTAWIVGINAPLYLAVCTCAPLLIRVFGHHYASGTTTMVVVSASGVVGAACGLVDYVLITAGRTTWNLGNSALALVLNIGIDVILVPHIGIIGAAIGWAAAIVANNLLPVWQIHRSLGFSPVSAVWLRLLIAAGVGFGLIPGLTVWLSHRSIVATVFALVVGSAGYLAALWLWRADLGLDPAALRRRPAA